MSNCSVDWGGYGRYSIVTQSIGGALREKVPISQPVIAAKLLKPHTHIITTYRLPPPTRPIPVRPRTVRHSGTSGCAHTKCIHCFAPFLVRPAIGGTGGLHITTTKSNVPSVLFSLLKLRPLQPTQCQQLLELPFVFSFSNHPS